MSETLFDLSQYKSTSGDRDHSDWIDATGADPAWNESSVTPASALSSNELATDTAHGWGSCAEFTITLESGQTIQGNFTPCLEGERRMHQFDFTGPVSTTGFKSHFVLAAEAEEFSHPRNYAQAYVRELVFQLEEKLHKAKSTKRSQPVAEVETPQERIADNDNSMQEPAMAENETTDSSHTPVEVVEELSPEEEAERQQLELTVKRGFYYSGKALTQLRDRRLYRSTHRKFEDYCQEQFGMKRIYAHYLINAAIIFDNLVSQCSQLVNIVPTSESQCRPLSQLEPNEQHQVWSEAVEMAGGKAPSARIVKDAVLRHKGIVERLKEKHPSSPEFAQGDVVEIRVGKRSPLHPFNGMWGIIEHVGSFSYTVQISIAKDVQQCKEDEMIKVDDEYTADIKAMSGRIAALIQFELEPIEYDIISNLQRSKCFTPTQLQLLEWLEQKHHSI